MTTSAMEDHLERLYAAYHAAQAHHWSTSQLTLHRRHPDGRPVSRAELEEALWRERHEWQEVLHASAAYYAVTPQERPVHLSGPGGAIPPPV
ncbi:hypothetical protein GCM10008955_30770 [Deinococcus malanensis]|uniref:Uncharacterized protein n=1 Tax=Deinococcus malanensis TaxID=1706855 RepID=A0ABQ2EZ30_9DEIO|nr:hypothetical protein [Deinococcus malanensis]GGK34620.1 hypothetical protein GCM10008955_30770 [Deinococcus malanensis]